MIAELKLEYNEPEAPAVTGKKGKKQKGSKAETAKVSEKTETVTAPATKAKVSPLNEYERKWSKTVP